MEIRPFNYVAPVSLDYSPPRRDTEREEKKTKKDQKAEAEESQSDGSPPDEQGPQIDIVA